MTKKNSKKLCLGHETVRALQTNDLVKIAGGVYSAVTACGNNCPPKETGTW